MDISRGVPFVLMRGGTSKGVFLRSTDVLNDRGVLTSFLLDLFGSPDRRQIDGIGGADKLTSKAAIIGLPSVEGADVDYLFGQVGVEMPEVDYNLNCGNLTAAVAVYAIEERLVEARAPQTAVRIHNVNTGKVIVVVVPVRDGKPMSEGGLKIGGVPGSGAPISLDFSHATGALTGRLLPLGEPAMSLHVPGFGVYRVSVVDGANLVVFVGAEEVGMSGTETPQEIDNNHALTARLNAIREEVANRVGLADYWSARAAPSSPFCVVVREPTSYRTFTTGKSIDEKEIDLVCRQYSSGSTSKALAATVTSCIGIASRIPGTIAAQRLGSNAGESDRIVIGHPSGTIEVNARVACGDAIQVERAEIFRTGRRIAEGIVYLKGAYLS